ncbi:hypothetical protein SODALDRAFT_358481 [Sodiomyces alkalinus F11]|uniref:Uncharacterized protein n=1 Tax=Sodiomyces alkalinus (strain CBS 110278 / VKM F-3762 / F11) TaxID=1314773 RepID=A0A3N2PZX8_SODAK|nr:hypothetical protein SODALDRAFT_358481 [Sodiomyces alkalinus F11]ROT40057.1 hypothetical protein SODALDRAFT_358481 [Sodiomyces alkalinus F11]
MSPVVSTMPIRNPSIHPNGPTAVVGRGNPLQSVLFPTFFPSTCRIFRFYSSTVTHSTTQRNKLRRQFKTEISVLDTLAEEESPGTFSQSLLFTSYIHSFIRITNAPYEHCVGSPSGIENTNGVLRKFGRNQPMMMRHHRYLTLIWIESPSESQSLDFVKRYVINNSNHSYLGHRGRTRYQDDEAPLNPHISPMASLANQAATNSEAYG